MTGKYPLNGDSTERRADAITESAEIGETYTRISESVLVMAGRNGAVIANDGWSEPARTEIEEEEPEREPVALEEQEGIDDPVRMYLREIGKVYLLSAFDEKRLARQMEEAKHLEALERRWLEEQNRLPTGQEVLLSLVEQYHQSQKCVKFICKDIGVKAGLVSDVIQNPAWRGTKR